MWNLFGHKTTPAVRQSAAVNCPMALPHLAEVIDTILPERRGQVLYRGSYWNAELLDPKCRMAIFPGERVRVVNARQLPILVMPIEDS